MNEELLKLYTALQPLFRERMGKLDPLRDFTIVDTPEGPIAIITPLTIDDSSPEAQNRSLLGMMSGLISIENKGKGRGYYVWIESGEVMQHFDGATATEAILRALRAQEGGWE